MNYFLLGQVKGDTPRPRLKKNAVPSQNLPLPTHGRKPNIVQNQKREQRLLQRELRKDMPQLQVNASVVVKPNESAKKTKIEATVPEKRKSTFALLKPTSQLKNSVPLKVQQKNTQVNTTADNTIIRRLNVMDLLTTQNKLNAWTGIPTFILLRKIEKRVLAALPQKMDGNDLSVLECVVFYSAQNEIKFYLFDLNIRHNNFISFSTFYLNVAVY